MIDVDGSDGGGQLVRSAVGLAALLGEPVTVESVRGARDDPGLKHQHVAAVECLAALTAATVEGNRLGSDRLVFDPGTVTPGHYEVDVGTAGATTLVADTLLPLALTIDEPLSVSITGGTDVKWSPPAEYLRQVKLPLLRQFGLSSTVEIDRRGYYPAGGGTLTLHVGPSAVDALQLTERGDHGGIAAFGVASADLEDARVAERLVEAVRDQTDEPLDHWRVEYDDSPETGAGVVLAAAYDHTTLGASALGEPGTPAETVASTAVERLTEARAGSAAVDSHMADQLLAILALVGGEIRIPRRTDHVDASLKLLDTFGVPVDVTAVEGTDEWLVSAPRRLDELR